MPIQHFMAGFRPKIGQNIGKFPYFHKIANISKSLARRNLELGLSVWAEIWTSYSLLKYLKTYRSFFENFDFSAWFADFCDFFIKFCHKSLRIRLKNENFQKSSCTFLDTSAKSNKSGGWQNDLFSPNWPLLLTFLAAFMLRWVKKWPKIPNLGQKIFPLILPKNIV